MPEGLVPRMAIEWGFLILLAVGAGIADLRPLLIVLVMLIGWVLVVLVELLAWRARPAFDVTETSSLPMESAAPAAMVADPASAPEEVAAPPLEPVQAPTEPVVPALPQELPPPAYDFEFEFERPEQEAETGVHATPQGGGPTAAPTFGATTTDAESRPDLDPNDPYAPAPERERLLEADQRAVYRLEPLKPRPRRSWFRRSPGSENERA